MPSQFFGLNISYTGLLASNAALNTTANNISNVETKGYSRQVVNQTAAQALRTFTTYGCAGAGVDTVSIERMRNEFYDIKYWNNSTRFGEQDVKAYYMAQIEELFNDDPKAGKDGFNTVFNKMYDAMSEIMKKAGSRESKTEFVGYAQSLADYFNEMATNLEKMQKDTNAEIKEKADQVNTIASQLASLNKQINTIEMTGGKANELRDQRTLLIDQLSAIVDVEVKETPVQDPTDPNRHTGIFNFQVKICGGQTLVNTGEYNTLECVARKPEEKANQSDIDGLYDLKWSNGLEVNIYGGNLGGELKALIQMRDGNNGENFNGVVSGVGTTVDGGVTKDTVTVDVTDSYLKDLFKTTLSDTGGIITLGNQDYSYDSWSATKNPDGSYSYTFTLSTDNETKINASRVGKNAEIGKAVEYQGIPYYQEQMNEFVRTYAAKFNEILTQEGSIDSNGDPAIYLFVADSKVSGDQYFFKDMDKTNENTWTISSDDDSYYQLTAKNFAVNKAIIEKPERFAVNTKDSADASADEKDKYDVIQQLVKMKSDKSICSFRNSSATEFLQCITSDVTLNAKRAYDFSQNYANISQSIEIRRLSVSGVDKDEEALNLTKYQNAYNLASKMISTFSEIYDRLILSTGV